MTKNPVKMTQVADDPILTLEIPKVKVLCQDLGFIDTDSQIKFRASVTNWRKGYRTASGIKGTALLGWDSEDERYDLGIMAQQFLESGSNAQDFWPSDGRSSAQVSPRYPNDKVEILQLLRRFMWRQNKYLESNGRRGNNSINGDRSGSEEEYSPLSPSQTSPSSSRPKRQARSKPVVDSSIAKNQILYDLPTWLQAEPVRGMRVPPGNHHHWPSSHAPHLSRLPPQLPASTGSPSNHYPRSAYSAPTSGSSHMSPKRGISEENIGGRSSQEWGPHPPLSGIGYIKHEASKRSRIPNPPDLSDPALNMSTGTPRGSNDAGYELNRQDNISTPSQLHSPSSQAVASDSEPSSDLNNQLDHPRGTAQLGNSATPQPQANPPATTVRPEVGIFIVESSGPHIDIKEWPGGSLRDRTLESIFNEVTTTFPGQPLQRIKFQLETLKKENGLECFINRDDDKIFGVMLQKFKKRMKERKKLGEHKFNLYLELDRGMQDATVSGASEASESEEDYL